LAGRLLWGKKADRLWFKRMEKSERSARGPASKLDKQSCGAKNRDKRPKGGGKRAIAGRRPLGTGQRVINRKKERTSMASESDPSESTARRHAGKKKGSCRMGSLRG